LLLDAGSILSKDRPGFSFKRKVTILELWYGMATGYLVLTFDIIL